MPRCNKTAQIASQSANSGNGLAPQHHRDYHRYDVEWSEQEAIDAEVSQLVSGGAAALRNPKRWRNSTSSGYSSHSPPLSAGSYSTCCASVLRNSAAGTLGTEAALGLAVIHEAEAIPRPIWPCTSVDPRDLHLVGCEALDCEGLSASCSYERAYTYASRCRNAWRDCQSSAPTAQDVLFELSRTLNSVIDGESGMTPEEILRDISRTVQKGIEANNGTASTGISEEHIYRLSSSSSSAIGKDSVAVNPVNLKLYGKSGYSNVPATFFRPTYQCLHEGKTLLVHSLSKVDEDQRPKKDQCHQRIPAVFLVPRCNAVHSSTLFNCGIKSVKNTNDKDGGVGRLIENHNHFEDKNKRTIRLESAPTKTCYTSGEPVYSTLDPSDESSSYGAVGESSEKVNWNQGITVFNKSLDFTLDGTRAEILGRIIARAKRRRQWCRALTTILGLVFFILSVVIVSMSITRGRKIFGSM
ncbi:uncharacterized protein [Chelonus insularis]|uniref:uncharacterized protein isoform X2 n=1 Tax=Chelonus insularis TaxID=460826 RepID=UPI00158A62C8|nr:uncharacterized protein LOC118074624 isoform X2 [Chelonus insularis]